MYIDGYVSDKIKDEEIEQWYGKNVLIVADTGMGKTTLIKNKVSNYAEKIKNPSSRS